MRSRANAGTDNLDNLKPTHAFVGPLYVGTNRLGRALTNAETRELAAFLRKHQFVGASMIALNFACKLARNKARAQDLHDRAYVRLVEQGWNASAVTLPKCLCRFVWSEHTHALREDALRRKAEAVLVHEQGIHHSTARSPEDFAVHLETETEEDAYEQKRISELRTAFVASDDKVNLLWLDFWLDGIYEPRVMAQRSDRAPEDFYRAADRRNRHVARWLAAESGAKFEEDE
jgi:hypothetical protein